RHFGVGADQMLVVEKAQSADADFRYRIINADGGEVEQCGNGARCFVRFVHEKGLSPKTRIRVETLGGLIEPQLEADGEVTVDMGVAHFTPTSLPFDPKHARATPVPHQYWLDVAATKVLIDIVSMGNPHAVQVVEDVEQAPVLTQGPLIEAHPAFPRRVNAGYMQIVSPTHIKLRVYERGAGETLACGTGACAAVVTGVQRGLLTRDTPVRVTTHGGDLRIRWAGPGAPVRMTGPAATVFEGEINVPDV
ncbi:MAG TPA: diaminopimelate epimerase, partial [Burkholderiales bacterium]|nr:diaminopimelate epimerase [Burkholderiales bacterium]